MARSAIMNVMVQAALKAGRALSRAYASSADIKVSLKKPGDYVSTADRKAEDIIKSTLLMAKPNYSYLMEEGGEIIGSDNQHRFIIDPLDGTTNFLHAVPFFCVSIALESQGKLVAAVIYNPILDELFTAERGQGAFLNDRRIRVSHRRNLEDCLISTGIPHIGKPEHNNYLQELRAIMPQSAGIRRTGAAALDLAYVASARFDGFWEQDLQPWDMAAGILLVTEAGGFISDKTGGANMLNQNNIVAGNEYTHKALLNHIIASNKE
ncbi:inositol monophosphatase family protein [Bartonella sp. TP]|uniref:inositol monophosphatase family protein n=1 Tax=Bartonella sp. TP TaxID=3057550 RepID=UPI0025B27D11|nr:inositol monophosphatase family protein [Bartonella sp. TP]WJW79619.1 inositol monophosphatase family protein [Bartonella sp. TP]